MLLGTACHVSGSKEIEETIIQVLGIKDGKPQRTSCLP